MKKTAVFILSTILLIGIVSAIGVTFPIPSLLSLDSGESGTFKFELQNNGGQTEVSFYIDEDSPLILTLPENQIIDANETLNVFGNVTVPENLASGLYIEKFCVMACPIGGNVCSNTCGLPVKVEVTLISQDQDNDGVLDSEDFCPNTIGEVLSKGCSCDQILDLKPGEDTSENRNGCSEGNIKVFEEAKGWAKNLF